MNTDMEEFRIDMRKPEEADPPKGFVVSNSALRLTAKVIKRI